LKRPLRITQKSNGDKGKQIKMSKTTISIEEETRDRLADIGKKRETYDTIINEIIDFYLEKM